MMHKQKSNEKLHRKSSFNEVNTNTNEDEDDFEIPQGLIDAIKEGNCVAFVGAGFSMNCNLPDWPTLLENIVDEVDPKNYQGIMTTSLDIKLIKDEKKVEFLRNTIKKAKDTGNADLFDLVAQILEDTIGARYVEKLVTKALEIPKTIPQEMKSRLDLLNKIPFKAILTTNFDLLTEGSTPWSIYPHDHNAYPYASILRGSNKYKESFSEINDLLVAMDEKLKQDIHIEGGNHDSSTSPATVSGRHRHDTNKMVERTLFSSLQNVEFDETEYEEGMDDICDYEEAAVPMMQSENDSKVMQRIDTTTSQDADTYAWQSYQVRSTANRPLIKLHGSLAVKNSLVWTRTGYRKLLHQTPGYANFLRSVLATSTVLYLGFSFSDGYLNDLRGEVLSMLYGEVSVSSGMKGLKIKEPIGYALVNDKSDYEIDFYQKHEGVQILTYDTKKQKMKIKPTTTNNSSNSNEDDNDTVGDFSGFDHRLKKIHELTSFAYHIGEITYGKRILVLELNSQGRGNLLKSKLDEAINKARLVALKNPGVFAQDRSKIEIPTIPYQIGDLNSVLQEDVFLKYNATYKKKKPNEHNDNPFTVCVSVDEVIEKLKVIADDQNSFRYDCIVTLFGEDFSKKGNALGDHKWKVLVDRMRALPVRCHTPFLVYASTGFNDPGRRRFCQSYGAYDYVTSLETLVTSLSTLLEPLEPLKPCSVEPPNNKEYEYV